MTQRLDYPAAAPDAFKTMLGFERYFRGARSSIHSPLIDLIKVRASQINGCAYCVDMHWKDARAEGETEERLYMLSVWRESSLYSARERAALAWTEALTRLSQRPPTDAEFEEVRKEFNDQELADLTWAIGAINVWNRLGVAFLPPPGVYQPPRRRRDEHATAEAEQPAPH
jgi:AhpD family alkylhydroperoxidase